MGKTNPVRSDTHKECHLDASLPKYTGHNMHTMALSIYNVCLKSSFHFLSKLGEKFESTHEATVGYVCVSYLSV